MLFVYQPEGAERKEWEFDPGRLMSPEAEAIERNTGMTYAEWTSAVRGGSILALHGLLYVMLKRSEPTLKWEQVQFCLDDVDFELDEQETDEAIANLEASDHLTEAQQVLLDNLRASRADVPKEGPSLTSAKSDDTNGDAA